jgi:hypothetical protein
MNVRFRKNNQQEKEEQNTLKAQAARRPERQNYST